MTEFIPAVERGVVVWAKLWTSRRTRMWQRGRVLDVLPNGHILFEYYVSRMSVRTTDSVTFTVVVDVPMGDVVAARKKEPGDAFHTGAKVYSTLNRSTAWHLQYLTGGLVALWSSWWGSWVVPQSSLVTQVATDGGLSVRQTVWYQDRRCRIKAIFSDHKAHIQAKRTAWWRFCEERPVYLADLSSLTPF